MYQSKITGKGHYVPDRLVTNSDLVEMMETTDEWIVERTGVLVQDKLNIDTISELDVRNQCTGFIYGLSADKLVNW